MPELKDILPQFLDSHRNSTKPDNLDDISWHYFLALEADFNNSIRFVDLSEENDATFSIEFARQLVCISTEFETITRQLCNLIDNSKPAGNIANYKELILSEYPEIPNAPVYIDRYKRTIFPLRNWKKKGGRLEWWDAYQHVKHDRQDYFVEATIKNTLYALASLLIMELYLYGTINSSCKNRKGGTVLLRAPGMVELMYVQPEENLPHLPREI